MPVLHLFITVDIDAFLSAPRRAQLLLEMCEKTLADADCGDDAHANAVKCFELLILQCGASNRFDFTHLPKKE